jgi:hypothetical protein
MEISSKQNTKLPRAAPIGAARVSAVAHLIASLADGIVNNPCDDKSRVITNTVAPVHMYRVPRRSNKRAREAVMWAFVEGQLRN